MNWQNVSWAALGGGLAALGIWMVASRALDKQFAGGAAQLRSQLSTGGSALNARIAAGRRELQAELGQQIQTQVPLLVERSLRTTLLGYGLTPQSGRELARLITAGDTLLRFAERQAS